MPNDFEAFFTQGKVGNTNLKDVFQNKLPSAFKKIDIKPIVIKPLKLPGIDPAVKQFFEKDVKNFINTDLKDAAITVKDTFKNGLEMPKKIGDLFNNVLSGMNTPLLLPAIVIIGAIVAIQVIKYK